MCEDQLKVQIIEKNKTIVELNDKASETSRELRRREEKIFELQNQIYFLKAQLPGEE